FNREELLGRELDTLNLQWAWLVFKSAFIGVPGPFWAWWRMNVWGTLKSLKWSILLALLFTLGGALIGSAQAEVFSIPADLLDWENLEEGLVTGIEEIGPIRFFSIKGAGIILFHNLRAIALASLMGIFSFGVLGIITLVFPFSIIGYFTGVAGQTGLSPWKFLFGFVIPHGIFEIPAIILAGALIIRLGLILVTPNEEYTIGEAWVRTLADWTRIMLLVIFPLLLAAAFIEVYITPLVALKIFGQ
ncbi:MAG: stage II sporulation protein M, partial [Anaerolineales bacterium]|nr:stage II sporulation protein M [Anaerolineales bacterium]